MTLFLFLEFVQLVFFPLGRMLPFGYAFIVQIYQMPLFFEPCSGI